MVMSGAKLLDFGRVLELQNLDFSDLEKRLKHRLKAIKTLPDLDHLIKLINPLLKANRFSTEEHSVLRRLRQRAYDRRRNPKFQTLKSVDDSKQKIQMARSVASIS